VENRWPAVSIIIPTQSFDARTKECLAGCEQLDYPDYEIIIIPDELSSETIDTGRRRWLAAAVLPGEKKNRGVSIARGEICAFIDSDAYPAPDWLKNGVRYLLSPENGAVGGPNLTPPHDNLSQKLCGLILSSLLALGKFSLRYRKAKLYYPLELPSCNLLVKKKLFQELKGFNTRLLTAEDASLSFEITRQGYRLVYAPDVVVYHHRRPVFRKYFWQIFCYGRDKRALLQSLPLREITGRLCYYLLPVAIPAGVLCLLMTIISPVLRPVFVPVFSVYFLSVLAESIYLGKRWWLLVGWGIIGTHFSYSYGFWSGHEQKQN